MPQTRPQVRQEVRYLAVSTRDDGQRLDNFLLKHLSGVPKSHVYRLLRSGQVRVNGGRCKPERRLAEGDQVRLPPVRMADKAEPVRPPDAVLERLRAAVIYEDDHYLVLNKPPALAVHAGSGLLFGVIEAVRAWEGYKEVELAHRLDRDTSGVLLLAKTRPALLRAQSAFRDGLAEKRYLALLCGRWQGGAREVDAALVKNRLQGGERMVELDETGKPAVSRFIPKKRYANATLVEVQIDTGRTHQIRVHAAALEHAVAGDGKYGRSEEQKPFRTLGLKRTFLHAEILRLLPQGDFPALNLQAPLPPDLSEFLKTLDAGR